LPFVGVRNAEVLAYAALSCGVQRKKMAPEGAISFHMGDRRSGRRGTGLAEQARAGCGVLGCERVDQFGGRADPLDHADALAAAPDVLPGLGLAAFEVLLARVARRQVV